MACTSFEFSTGKVQWAKSAEDKLMIFFLFSQKTGFDISFKLSAIRNI